MSAHSVESHGFARLAVGTDGRIAVGAIFAVCGPDAQPTNTKSNAAVAAIRMLLIQRRNDIFTQLQFGVSTRHQVRELCVTLFYPLIPNSVGRARGVRLK